MNPQFATATPNSTAEVGMTLAAIAYQPGLAAIKSTLANPKLATQGRWSVTWYGVDPGNQVYVAQDGQTGQYAIASRGSADDPFTPAFWIDWFDQDLSVFRQADWPYGGAPDGSTIAQGSLHGLGSVLSLIDSDGNSLVDFLRSVPKPQWLTAVIGHSLGGALASVLASYLHQEFSPNQNVLDFWPVTFAAPTAGNSSFAQWVEQQFAASVGRYHNTLDVVPHAWAGLNWIAASFANGPNLPDPLKLPIKSIHDFLKLTHADYQQPGPGNPLQGTLVPNVDWFHEAGAQHASATYLSLVGAAPIT